MAGIGDLRGEKTESIKEHKPCRVKAMVLIGNFPSSLRL